MKPGQEIKTAKRQLEEQLLKLFREFNEKYDCEIQSAYPMYDLCIGSNRSVIDVKVSVEV